MMLIRLCVLMLLSCVLIGYLSFLVFNLFFALLFMFFFFFFSSRRRHTRSLRDWSSDVCSSDLRSAITKAGRRFPPGPRKRNDNDFASYRFDHAASSSGEFQSRARTDSPARRQNQHARCVRSPELSGGNAELVFVPEPQHQQCAKDRHDDPGRMKLRARFGTRKDVRHQSADNRTDDPEPDRPEKRHVHVHDRFRRPPRDQTNDDVPNQMKHDDVSSFELKIGGYRDNAPETMRISGT